MKVDVIMLVLFFAAKSSSTLASTLILFAMIGEINRKRESSRIQYFHFSWIRVLREYRLLYPQGRYTISLFVAIFLAVAFSLVSVYLLFGVLPKYALPSR